MKKDIFIDNNIANKFAVPPDNHYKELIEWLLYQDNDNPDNNAYLVASNFIRKEYWDSNNNCNSEFSIVTIYSELQKQDRLNLFKTKEIKDFVKNEIDNKGNLNLASNKQDHYHFYPVFKSDRKMVLTEDKNLASDLLNFPKFKKGVCIQQKPELLNYK